GYFHFFQQTGQVAQFYSPTGSFDCTTFTVAQYDYKFGAGKLTGKFHAAKNVLIDDISGDPHAEDISQALVKNQLRRSPAVDTAKYYGEGELTVFRRIDLL